MKKLIIAVMFTMFAGTAYAGCSAISSAGLSNTAHQKLILACEQAKLNELQSPNPVDIMQEYAAYGQYAKQIAEAVGILAQELGMAVDEFLHTDAGMLVAVLLIWKIAGASVLGFIIGVPMIIAIWMLVLKAGKNMLVEDREERTVKGWFGSEKVVTISTYRQYRHLGEDEQVVLWVGTIVAGIITCILLFALVV